MKFRKYHGHIKDRLLMLIVITAILFFLSMCISVQLSNYRLLFFLGLLPGVSMAVLIVSSLLEDIYLINHDHISDMILINEDGINLKSKKGQSESISWEAIAKIEKVRSRNLSPRIFVTSIDGKKIWWYVTDKEAERYIFEQHPELTKIYTERKGY